MSGYLILLIARRSCVFKLRLLNRQMARESVKSFYEYVVRKKEIEQIISKKAEHP